MISLQIGDTVEWDTHIEYGIGRVWYIHGNEIGVRFKVYQTYRSGTDYHMVDISELRKVVDHEQDI